MHSLPTSSAKNRFLDLANTNTNTNEKEHRYIPFQLPLHRNRFPYLGKIICPKDKEELSCLSGKRNSGVDDMTLCQYNSYHFPLFRILRWRLLFYPFSIFCFYCTFSVPQCKTCSANEENIIEKEALSKLRFVFHFGTVVGGKSSSTCLITFVLTEVRLTRCLAVPVLYCVSCTY